MMEKITLTPGGTQMKQSKKAKLIRILVYALIWIVCINFCIWGGALLVIHAGIKPKGFIASLLDVSMLSLAVFLCRLYNSRFFPKTSGDKEPEHTNHNHQQNM